MSTAPKQIQRLHRQKLLGQDLQLQLLRKLTEIFIGQLQQKGMFSVKFLKIMLVMFQIAKVTTFYGEIHLTVWYFMQLPRTTEK